MLAVWLAMACTQHGHDHMWEKCNIFTLALNIHVNFSLNSYVLMWPLVSFAQKHCTPSDDGPVQPQK